MRAADSSKNSSEEEHAAFLKLSAWLMKRLLILHSRPLARRVGRDLLDRLARIDGQLRTVVELRVFEVTGDETAKRLGCSPRTEARHWKFARNWLAGAVEAPNSQ